MSETENKKRRIMNPVEQIGADDEIKDKTVPDECKECSSFDSANEPCLTPCQVWR